MFLRMFLFFRGFQPGCSYKLFSYIKKGVVWCMFVQICLPLRVCVCVCVCVTVFLCDTESVRFFCKSAESGDVCFVVWLGSLND